MRLEPHRQSATSAATTCVMMALKDLLSPADVVLDVRAAAKPEALQAMTRQLARRIAVDAEEVYQAISQREELGSTGMGDGVAVPHARLAGVQQPVGIFARLKHPVDFGAIDERPVDLIFMILLPEGTVALTSAV